MSDIEKVKKLREATGAGFKDCNLAIKESVKLGIPIVAILDTNSNPDGIDFPIPGNDDARRSIDLYCSLLKETIINAKKESPQNTVRENDTEALKIETSNPEKPKEEKLEKKLN